MVLDIDAVLLPEIFRPLHTAKSQLRVDTVHTGLVLLGQGGVVTTKVDIHLLERLVLGLGDELPDERGTHGAEAGEEDVSPVRHAARGQHVLGGETDDEVEHPVGGGDDGDTAGPERVGKDLLGDDPGDGAPRVGKVGGEEPDEDDGGPAGVAVRGPVGHEGALDAGDDGVADHHAQGTGDQKGLAAEFIQEQHRGEGEDDLDDTGDTGRQQVGGGVGETETFEDLGCVVQDGVDTSLEGKKKEY